MTCTLWPQSPLLITTITRPHHPSRPQYHCNAHANNVILLDETVSKANNFTFLAYLDLDMVLLSSAKLDTNHMPR